MDISVCYIDAVENLWGAKAMEHRILSYRNTTERNILQVHIV